MYIAIGIVLVIAVAIIAISYYETAKTHHPFEDDIDDWGPTFLGDVEVEDYDQT